MLLQKLYAEAVRFANQTVQQQRFDNPSRATPGENSLCSLLVSILSVLGSRRMYGYSATSSTVTVPAHAKDKPVNLEDNDEVDSSPAAPSKAKDQPKIQRPTRLLRSLMGHRVRIRRVF